MRAVLSNPAVQGSLSNPRVMQAFRAMMEDPSAANNYLDDPEIGPVLAQVLCVPCLREIIALRFRQLLTLFKTNKIMMETTKTKIWEASDHPVLM